MKNGKRLLEREKIREVEQEYTISYDEVFLAKKER